jgi:ATP-dependent Clp protease ATP-binding subunit ClpX
MMDVMYKIPSDENVEECIVTKAAVEGESQPLLVYKDQKRLKTAK